MKVAIRLKKIEHPIEFWTVWKFLQTSQGTIYSYAKVSTWLMMIGLVDFSNNFCSCKRCLSLGNVEECADDERGKERKVPRKKTIVQAK